MLVLTRKQNEEIQIGDNIRLTVLRVKGNTVRIGIQAPSDVRVVRGELPARPQVKEVTVMVTDSESGAIREAWPSESGTDKENDSFSEQRSSGTARWSARIDERQRTAMNRVEPKSKPDTATSDLRPLRIDTNRLKEIVGEVNRHSATKRHRAR